MMVRILAFGMVKDIFGSSEIKFETKDKSTIFTLRESLEHDYPGLHELSSYRVAVNNKFADSDHIILPADEIALIPPVSGG